MLCLLGFCPLYSSMDCSAVRGAVRRGVFEAKIQQGRQQCCAGCCQNGRFRGENTAAKTAVRCRLLSESIFRAQKYSSTDSAAVRFAVSSGRPYPSYQCLSCESNPSYWLRLSLSFRPSGLGMWSIRKSSRSSLVSYTNAPSV